MAGERIERAAYGVRDLMTLYGVGRSTLYRDIAAGRLIAHKFGGKTVFFADDVARWSQAWRRVWPRQASA
jgi:excisionase family DNA binding protein